MNKVSSTIRSRLKKAALKEAALEFTPWPITVATYNIHGAVGCDGLFSPARVADVLREIDADVIALQEVPLGDSKTSNVLMELQRATGFAAAEGAACDNPERRFGNAVLSRYPIEAVRCIDLSFSSREPRSAVDADINFHGHLLRIVATHLGLQPAERRHQIRRLLEVFDTEEMPVILMGDINEWFMWGRPLRWLVSHFQAVPAPRTFPSRYPMFALDRIWIRPRHRLVHVMAHASPLARIASDHLPLIAHIAG